MSARFESLPLRRFVAAGDAEASDGDASVRSIAVSGLLDATGRLELTYVLHGDLAQLLLPADNERVTSSTARRDELWRHTCMELFARGDHALGYLEFNFSPNGDWAAYGFDAYRAGRRDVAAHDSHTQVRRQEGELRLQFSITAPLLAAAAAVDTWHLGIAAIVERDGGALSYWALRHPRSQPDFHDPDGFSYSLQAPPR